ncbi:hypothetical protein B5F83_01025 [Muribaculum sp. An289]|uniref:DUF6046 domain-containing protein n=1 Tax=unclassified Muribaculum TaxID=2622126 RepID=UPI000B374493|nr:MULTISPECIES: DUF6046 domain-containing protein [unclassified Muribaculum]OUO38478.1 hypothetical protein B5F83_01025 [Muribaculum sp. An289]OUO43969.1 hypothetical protein B5F81_02000 [Muribaculum sp. An287]
MITKFILGNILSRVLPGKLPPYFLFDDTAVADIPPDRFTDIESMDYGELEELVKTNAIGVPMVFPLQLRMQGKDWWTLPLEPLITINGTNVITKKQVSKGKVRGSIKERWTQGDYQLSIEGILTDFSGNDYPYDDVRRLKEHCEAASVEVACPLFEVFSINRMVIEDYSFPFTSGRHNQAYRIAASSDDIYRLLLKKDDLKQL